MAPREIYQMYFWTSLRQSGSRRNVSRISGIQVQRNNELALYGGIIVRIKLALNLKLDYDINL